MNSKEKFLEPEIRDGVEVSAELKGAWRVLLDMFEEFVRICEKYGLEYCLDGGTLLGAIRHKGFIPWDDDLDVSLPRKDFQRLLEVAEKELKPPYFFQYGTTDPEHCQGFACIRDSWTSGIDLNWVKHGKRHHMGIGMDIFPFDDIPANSSDMKWMFRRHGLICRVYTYVFSHCLTGWRKWLVKPVANILYRFIGPKRLIRWRDRNLASFSNANVTRYGNLAFRVGGERGYFRREVFADRIKVHFEYLEAYAPIGYEEYLAQLYGPNWRMPIRGAGSHDSLLIDTKRPYKDLLFEKFDYKKDWLKDLP